MQILEQDLFSKISKINFILASSSKIRAKILQKYNINFTIIKTDFDEEKEKDKITHLKIKEQALHLAKCKALSISDKYRDELIIGCDQICEFNNQIINKPKNKDDAINQLLLMSGEYHRQINSLAIAKDNKIIFHKTNIANLKLRKLSIIDIKSYVEKDDPIGCSGSYKLEKNGKILFSEINSNDSLVSGLDIISVIDFIAMN